MSPFLALSGLVGQARQSSAIGWKADNPPMVPRLTLTSLLLALVVFNGDLDFLQVVGRPPSGKMATTPDGLLVSVSETLPATVDGRADSGRLRGEGC